MEVSRLTVGSRLLWSVSKLLIVWLLLVLWGLVLVVALPLYQRFVTYIVSCLRVSCVSSDEDGHPVLILRDTGAAQSLMLSSVTPVVSDCEVAVNLKSELVS